MSIKFRQDDHVSIIFEFDPDSNYRIYKKIPIINLSNVSIILGPVTNRIKCTKSYYDIKILNEYNNVYDTCLKHFESCIMRAKNRNILVQFDINFKKLKKYFNISHASEIHANSMTDNELLDDLDFMNDEIIKFKIKMNILEQQNEHSKLNFYKDLLNDKQYIMFQIPSANEYMEYLDKISTLLDNKSSNEKRIMNEVMNLSYNVW